jgi:hypothetical protein
MTTASIQHNLDDTELCRALAALADSSGIGEELHKAIKRKDCDDEPKEPRHPAMRHLYRQFLNLHQEAARDIERYAREIMAETAQ